MTTLLAEIFRSIVHAALREAVPFNRDRESAGLELQAQKTCMHFDTLCLDDRIAPKLVTSSAEAQTCQSICIDHHSNILDHDVL